MSEQIGILRHCVRCQRYESIDNFMPLAKVCQPCMSRAPYRPRVGNYGAINRGITITNSGRELLRQWRVEEAANTPAPAA